jgi:transposase
MEHIGIDLHKNSSQICICTEEGRLIERRIQTSRPSFVKALGSRPRARIVVESSTESEWVARCLEELGHEVVVADHPAGTEGHSQSRRSQDQVDAPDPNGQLGSAKGALARPY